MGIRILSEYLKRIIRRISPSLSWRAGLRREAVLRTDAMFLDHMQVISQVLRYAAVGVGLLKSRAVCALPDRNGLGGRIEIDVSDLLRHDAADTELMLLGRRIELGDSTDLPLTIKTTPDRITRGHWMICPKSFA